MQARGITRWSATTPAAHRTWIMTMYLSFSAAAPASFFTTDEFLTYTPSFVTYTPPTHTRPVLVATSM